MLAGLVAVDQVLAGLVLAGLVAVDQVLAGLVAVALVAVALVAVALVAVALVPRSAVRGPWRVSECSPAPGAQKTGRVAGCAGFSPVLHGPWRVKQF